jgi:hypothetical protein
LEVAVVVPVINWELVGSRAVVFGEHKREIDIDGQLIGYPVIDVLEKNKRADVTDVYAFTTRAEVVLYEIILQGVG